MFFESIPDAVDAAFVVVLHLDPERQSELPNILPTRTKMPVTQVSGLTPIEPRHVYVIPPNRQLRATDHHLAITEFDEPRWQRAPIDLFFRSLASQGGDDFAVILTGAGSDGSVGIKAVKEAGGIILVQDPDEAEYGSMPRSAVATGLADFVLPVREIAARLPELIRNRPNPPSDDLTETDEEAMPRILSHLRVRSGHDFSSYKKSTVRWRIARRMQAQRAATMADYLGILRESPQEAQALFADLLISVTTFFRDTSAFENLAASVIPRLFDDKGVSDTIRVWVPGCATGEEAYSIAILLLEEAACHEIRCGLQVLASDLDENALAVASEGRYPIAIEADMTEERLRRFFTRESDHYRVTRELRDAVLIAKHSLLKDPPFSRVDLISCRNVLIYLDREVQQQVCATFHLPCARPDTSSSARPKTQTVPSERSAPSTANLSAHVCSAGSAGHAAGRGHYIWV
jgi:two-component system CheB/CheR fusion protein